MALGHPAYPDQVVISLATVGANLADNRWGARPRSRGDVMLLTVLLLLTGTIAGWHLARAAGALVGLVLASSIAFARFRAAS
jgi:hypothetical protein